MKPNSIFIPFRLVHHALLSALLAVAFVGCAKENDHLPDETPQVNKVSINLSFPGMKITRAGQPITDESIGRVRILAFDRNNRDYCVMNQLVNSPADPFEFQLSTGRYDFCFVMNEPDNSPLANVQTRSVLESTQIERSKLISAEGYFVMCGTQPEVVVEANHHSPAVGGSYQAMVTFTDAAGISHTRVNNLVITAQRLAVRANVRLINKADGNPIPTALIGEVKVTGLPISVPILPGIPVNSSTTSELVLDPATLNTHPNNGTTYAGYTGILPAYHFLPLGDEAKAARLSAKLNDEATPRTMAIGHDIVAPGLDYTLHRNTIYHITGKMDKNMELDITVRPWDEQEVAEEAGVAWVGDTELYLSSRSPIGLRRAGLLKADDYSLEKLRVEIIDNVSPAAPRVKAELVRNSVPMKDRDNEIYFPDVNHLKGLSNQDIVLTQTGGFYDVADIASVANDKVVTLRIYHPSFTGGHKDATVYLNRSKVVGSIWMDRNMGSNNPQRTGNYYRADSRPACPNGFRLPSQAEWMRLHPRRALNDSYKTDGLRTPEIPAWSFNETGYLEMRTGSKVYFPMAGFIFPPAGVSNSKAQGLFLGINLYDELYSFNDDLRVFTQNKLGIDTWSYTIRCIKTP